MIFHTRIGASSSLGGQTGLMTGQTGLGGQIGCIDWSDQFIQNLQLSFCLYWLSNVKIFLHTCIARSQSVNLSILLPWYMSYNKFMKGRNNIETLIKICIYRSIVTLAYLGYLLHHQN